MNLDLSNPIFVYYIYVGGMSKVQIEEICSNAQNALEYNNTTLWIVPIHEGQSRIEMLHHGYR